MIIVLSRFYYIAIDSIKILQANDIGKVLDVVKMIGEGTLLIPENIDGLTTERQVQYYKSAAYALGLATKDNRLTPAGYFINSLQYMTELKPETAKKFLTGSVPDLNKITAKRRASTLAKWLTELQPYHRKYKSSKKENQ